MCTCNPAFVQCLLSSASIFSPCVAYLAHVSKDNQKWGHWPLREIVVLWYVKCWINVGILLYNYTWRRCAVLHDIPKYVHVYVWFFCLHFQPFLWQAHRRKEGLICTLVSLTLLSLCLFLSLCVCMSCWYIFPAASSHTGSSENMAICFLDSLCSNSNSKGV